MNEWNQLQAENEKRIAPEIKRRHEPGDEEASIMREVRGVLLAFGIALGALAIVVLLWHFLH